jgi:hypothetical protein
MQETMNAHAKPFCVGIVVIVTPEVIEAPATMLMLAEVVEREKKGTVVAVA